METNAFFIDKTYRHKTTPRPKQIEPQLTGENRGKNVSAAHKQNATEKPAVEPERK